MGNQKSTYYAHDQTAIGQKYALGANPVFGAASATNSAYGHNRPSTISLTSSHGRPSSAGGRSFVDRLFNRARGGSSSSNNSGNYHSSHYYDESSDDVNFGFNSNGHGYSGAVRYREHPSRNGRSGSVAGQHDSAAAAAAAMAANDYSNIGGMRRSLSVLQHISEREPDDEVGDPSNSPTARTLFISCSRLDIYKLPRSKSVNRLGDGARSYMRTKPGSGGHASGNNNSNSQTNGYSQGGGGDESSSPIGPRSPIGRKSNSCSTIFIGDSTASQPNLKYMLKAVALALYFHLRNPHRPVKPPNQRPTNNTEIFDERLHPLWLDPACGGDPIPTGYQVSPATAPLPPRLPDFRTIYRYLRMLFHSAQLTAECAVVGLVYLERILLCGEMSVAAATWRRMVLGAVLLASKVWDDQAVWNVDFCSIIKNITVEEMNELERVLLELIQFNINVPSSVYTKYFFDLRSLASEHGLVLPILPLSKERAARLEAVSWIRTDSLQATAVPGSPSAAGQAAPSPPKSAGAPVPNNAARPSSGSGSGKAIQAATEQFPALNQADGQQQQKLATSPGASTAGSPMSLHRSRSQDHLFAERYRSRQSIVIS